jgi:glycosyltransferase involved in cell wall biosynthesis/Tfp pilus assembly protein PilF
MTKPVRTKPVANKDYAYLLKDLERAESRNREKLNPDQKLSLCMIVKDEEGYLEDALASVEGVVDEIIIVDTGSTDKTVEIARKFGARVYFRAWDDDFAAARNESLKHATGQWVLIMDADERIPEGLAQNLRALLIPTEQPISYLTYIKNYMRESDESSILGHYVVRLFRKTPETRFFGAIHEQLYPNWGHVTIPEDSFHLLHLGYGDLKKKEGKIKNRNTPLIQKALEQAKGNNQSLYSFYAYYMGSGMSDPKEMMHWMKESIETCPDPVNTPHVQVAYLELLKAYYYARDYAGGIAAAKEGLSKVPSLNRYPDFLESFGVLLTANKQFEEALVQFSEVLSLVQSKTNEDQLFFTMQSSRIGSWGTLFNMMLAANAIPDRERAEAFAKQALEAYPDQDKSPLVDRIDGVLGASHITEELFENLEKDAKLESYQAKILSNHYLKQEKPFEAIMLQSQQHDLDHVIRNGSLLAEQYIDHQRLDLARKTFEGLLSLDENNLDAQLGLYFLECHEHEKQPDPQKIDAFFEKSKAVGDYAAVGRTSLRLGLIDHAQKSFEKLADFPSHYYESQLQLALIEQERGAVEAAMLRLKDLLTFDPERVDSYVQLGNILVMYGQFEQAQELFQQAIILEQGNWYYYYGLALALAGQEHFQKAENSLAMSARLSPNQGNVINLYYLIQDAKKDQEASAEANSDVMIAEDTEASV